MYTTFTPHSHNIYTTCKQPNLLHMYTTFTPHLHHINNKCTPHAHRKYICTTFTPHLDLHLAASTVLDVSLNLTSSMLSVTFIKLVVSLLAQSWKARFLNCSLNLKAGGYLSQHDGFHLAYRLKQYIIKLSICVGLQKLKVFKFISWFKLFVLLFIKTATGNIFLYNHN